MLITFKRHAAGCSPSRWNTALHILKIGNPCKAEISGRGGSKLYIGGKLFLNYWRYYIILIVLARKGGKYAGKA